MRSSPESVRTRESAQDGTALVVESNRDEAAVLAAWLRRRAERVLTAESGAEAVSLARRAVPDWIFVDDALPDMSPVELAHRVRSNEELEGARVVALVDDSRRVTSGPFDRVLERPLHTGQLTRLMDGASCQPG